jgi:hypothetical protein
LALTGHATQKQAISDCTGIAVDDDDKKQIAPPGRDNKGKAAALGQAKLPLHESYHARMIRAACR